VDYTLAGVRARLVARIRRRLSVDHTNEIPHVFADFLAEPIATASEKELKVH
jgi:hypothetical protein